VDNLGDLASADKEQLRRLYLDRQDAPLWVDGDGLTSHALAVLSALHRAEDWGLHATKLELTAIQQKQADLNAAGESSPTVVAELEAMMTAAVSEYARQARTGRINPEDLFSWKFWDQNKKTVDIPKLLADVAKANDAAAAVKALHPAHPQYHALAKQYAALKRDKADPRFDVKLPSGPTLKPGMSHPHVATLRKRLGVEAGETPKSYDETLIAAVEAFQKKRGLKVDGVIGPNTRNVLNGAAGNRLERLLVNLERWRWMPDDLGQYYVNPNVPEYRFRVMDGTRVVHSERIVVGKPRNATPVFSDKMERIEFNPKWHVPNSIKVEEILPGLRSGRDTLARSNLRMLDRSGRYVDPLSVNWSATDIRSYHIYQPPGGPNVLGDMKFMFPNKHIVYMHDTSSKSLFAHARRAYSHGCMRVRNPREFARVILARDKGWTMDRINSVIAGGRLTPVYLDEQVPVHVTYFTARVDDDGELQFFDDVYKYDSRTLSALKGKPLPMLKKSAPRIRAVARDTRPTNRDPLSSFSQWAQNAFGLR